MTLIKKLWRKLWYGFKGISVEISSLLFMTSVLMTYLIMQDLLIGRVCSVNLGYSKDVCQAVIQNNGNYTTEEEEVQKVMTQLRKTRAYLDYPIPIIFVLLHGSWSDANGRKLTLLLPCIGFILQALSLFISMQFEHWNAYTIVLISTIPKCISGGDVTFRMAALSYASDISAKRSRTIRTGLVSSAFTLGVPLGFALGGASVKASIGSDISFLVSAGIAAAALLITIIFVDNNPKLNAEESTNTEKRKSQKFCSFANLKSVLKSVVLSFDGVSMAGRIQFFLLIVVIICINAPIQGEFGIMYFYLRMKLGWDLGDYSLFSTYISLIGVIGTIISVGLFCSYLKLSDPVVGFIAGVSQFGGCFMYTFAYTNFMIYLDPMIHMFNGTMAVVAKSMLSKLTPAEDYGKMFSLLGVIELVVPLVFDPTYSTLYEKTMKTFPVAVFLLSAALTVLPQLTYLFYIWKDRNTVSCEITPEETKSEDGRKMSSFKSRESVSADSIDNIIYSNHNHVALKPAISTTTVDTVVY